MSSRTGPDILAGPLRGGSALVRDYLAGRDLSTFYTAHPADAAAYVDKAAEVDARLDATSRAPVAPAIRPLGDAADRLRRIVSGDGYFVTTGQQPALFGGPLYTVYKILSAIRLADELERRLDRPVLALFWVGSDDHDWDEANHVSVLDTSSYVERIEVRAPADAPPLPLNERTWGEGVTGAVERLLELLPAAGHARDLREHIRETYVPGATVSGSSTRTLEHLLGDRRLAIVDAADPAVRRAAAPVLRREIERSGEHAAAVDRQTRRLLEAGYHAQVGVDETAANIMLLDEAGRDRLVRGRGGWLTRRGQRPMSEPELLSRLEARPDEFSPNVLLRPIVESSLFPTIAYVAGPGELSYFAQTGCLFAAHGIRSPVIVPRASVTLIEPGVRKTLASLNLEPAFFDRPYAELVGDVLRSEVPGDVKAALEDVRDALHTSYARLAEHASAIDPTLHGTIMAARNAALLRTRRAEKRIVTQLGRRNGVLLERLRRVSAHLYPARAPQERVLNMLQYVAQYGPDLIREIESAIDMSPAAFRAGAAVPTWRGPSCD